MKRRIFLAIVGLFTFLSISPDVFAAEPIVESITLSPVAKRYSLKAGETISDELTVVNDGKEAYDFIGYAKPYSVSSEDYNPDFNTESTNADAHQWVKFDKPKYRLEAGASTTVRFTMTVPEDVAPGGHYGVLFVETQPKPPVGGGNAVARKKRVGAILYVTVDGTYRTGGKQESSNVPFLQLSPPLTATLKTANDGNSDFVDSVSFRVSDLFGSLKYEEKKEYPILPQTARKMTLEWKDATSFGFYKVDITSKFLDQTHYSSGLVLLMPAWAIGILIALLVGGVSYLIVRRYY